jgi:hypothetical protein
VAGNLSPNSHQFSNKILEIKFEYILERKLRIISKLDHFKVKQERTIRCLVISANGHFINLAFYQLAILSIYHFVNLAFYQPGILSYGSFISLSFY